MYCIAIFARDVKVLLLYNIVFYFFGFPYCSPLKVLIFRPVVHFSKKKIFRFSTVVRVDSQTRKLSMSIRGFCFCRFPG